MVSLRRFTSLCISFSFLVMAFTGIILFIVPQGKIANWTNWELFGLSKTQYGNLHVTFMVLFLVGMIFHIYLNWKPLMNYLKNRNREFSLFTKEFLLAFALNLVFIIGTLYYVQPFKIFLDFQESIKQSWVTKDATPPYGHAEDSSLKSLCQQSSINLDEAISSLEVHGIRVANANQKLSAIAKENNRTPNEVYNLIVLKNSKSISTNPTTSKMPQQGSGLGRMNLKEVCKMYNLNIEQALQIINKDSQIAKKDTKVKEISNQLGVTPIELLERLK